jgi:hypothetical protein
MKFHTFEVSEEAKKIVQVYNPDEAFSMTKMFGSDNEEQFNDESSVKLFPKIFHSFFPNLILVFFLTKMTFVV